MGGASIRLEGGDQQSLNLSAGSKILMGAQRLQDCRVGQRFPRLCGWQGAKLVLRSQGQFEVTIWATPTARAGRAAASRGRPCSQAGRCAHPPPSWPSSTSTPHPCSRVLVANDPEGPLDGLLGSGELRSGGVGWGGPAEGSPCSFKGLVMQRRAHCWQCRAQERALGSPLSDRQGAAKGSTWTLADLKQTQKPRQPHCNWDGAERASPGRLDTNQPDPQTLGSFLLRSLWKESM